MESLSARGIVAGRPGLDDWATLRLGLDSRKGGFYLSACLENHVWWPYRSQVKDRELSNEALLYAMKNICRLASIRKASKDIIKMYVRMSFVNCM